MELCCDTHSIAWRAFLLAARSHGDCFLPWSRDSAAVTAIKKARLYHPVVSLKSNNGFGNR